MYGEYKLLTENDRKNEKGWLDTIRVRDLIEKLSSLDEKYMDYKVYIDKMDRDETSVEWIGEFETIDGEKVLLLSDILE